MSGLSQFTGGARVPKVLINSTSTTGSTAQVINASQPAGANAKNVLSGAVVANTLKTIVSLTGSGVVNVFSCSGQDATARTHRLTCTIDGVVVYDATTASVAAVNSGIGLIGAASGTGLVPSYDQIVFNSSFLVEYASSLSETDKTMFGYIYRTN